MLSFSVTSAAKTGVAQENIPISNANVNTTDKIFSTFFIFSSSLYFLGKALFTPSLIYDKKQEKFHKKKQKKYYFYKSNNKTVVNLGKTTKVVELKKSIQPLY